MMKHYRPTLLIIALGLFMVFSPVRAAPGDITLASVDSSGAQGNASSWDPSISSDGRYIAFESDASNLVAGDTNGQTDIFRYDTQTGTTIQVSVDSSGTQGNNSSSNPSISSDGRFIAFSSFASNLVTGDTNTVMDIFRHDTQTGTTTMVSVDSSGGLGNDASITPAISSDGRFIAFTSYASNLAVGDTNDLSDVFLHDTQTGTTTRVSVNSSGVEGNSSSRDTSISSDGRYLAFESFASNLVPGDTNGQADIFRHDTQTGTTIRISVDSSGAQVNGISGDPSISGDGRYIAFDSTASNLVAVDTNGARDVFRHDTQTGTTTMVSVDSSGGQGNNSSFTPAISSDGRFIAFTSDASNLAAGDTNGMSDVFLHDTQTCVTTMVSVDSSGTQGNDRSLSPTISGDGRYVAIISYASNLVAGDANGVMDVFVNEVDLTPPVVVFGALSQPPSQGANLPAGPSQLHITFNQNVLSDSGVHAANSTRNFMLLQPGGNKIFDTTCTAAAICDAAHTPVGDDVLVNINGVSYDPASFTATLTINPAAAPLTNNSYRLYVCGDASIWNLRSVPLNSGANSTINFSVSSSGGGGSSAASIIPATGFAPGRVTRLPRQTVAYADHGRLRLEIPALGVAMPVVGVPRQGDSWDVSWLGEDAGWLEGTAFPSWAGNSVITGHVWNADNTPGPFRSLETLHWGDQVFIQYAGQLYVYEVRGLEQVDPSNVRTMLRHEEQPWLTLITCKDFDEKTNRYNERILVRAVLIDVR